MLLLVVCYAFSAAFHPLLLSESTNILLYLGMPLAGPEDYADEEMDRLPIDFQYLPPDKTREELPEIRQMLIEALTQVTRLFLITHPPTSLCVAHMPIYAKNRRSNPHFPGGGGGGGGGGVGGYCCHDKLTGRWVFECAADALNFS